MASDDTTTAILNAAERLFAAQGYDAVSIREITREAGVNVAAVHYHFGDKPALLRAVTGRIVEPLNERRFHLLDLARAAASPEPPSIEATLDAFIRPDIETLQSLHRRGPTVAHFLGRVYADQTDWIQEMAQEQFGPAGERFFPVIAEALPHLGVEDISWRMSRVAAVIVHSFAGWPVAGVDQDTAEWTIRQLVNFSAAALSAPVVQ